MRRKYFLLFVLLTVPVFSYAYECPVGEEKAEDCPWAGVARLLNEKADSGKDLEPVFKAHIPGLLSQMDRDGENAVLLKLWGESINYDELADGEIVHPGVLSFISARLGAAQPRGRIAHAGLEHTYGYLFSLLPTKFGFKRARWVRPDIERGLGLPEGAGGPSPDEGSLLANITCLAGGIALKDDSEAWALLERAGSGCSKAVKQYSFAGMKRVRLTEEVKLSGGREVVLRTDFVPFSGTYGGNTHLLVYSVYDSGLRRAYLVTAFPVNSGFVQNATNPAGLGEGKVIQTRYNAYVEGITGVGKFKGTRSVSEFEK